MQTFLLSTRSFSETALYLDSKRLNKQLLEGRQMLAGIMGEPCGWKNHPAYKMWEPYPFFLHGYLYAIKNELAAREIKWQVNWEAIQRSARGMKDTGLPWWMKEAATFDRIVASHRAALHRKAPILYPFWKDVEAETCHERCNYYWPTHLTEAA